MRVLMDRYRLALDDRLAADYIQELAKAFGRDFNAEIAKTSLGIYSAWQFGSRVWYMDHDSHNTGRIEVPL